MSKPTNSRTKTSSAAIIAAIEDDVVSGKFVPDQRLDERELALRFGVSRTPIREALNRLAATGLIVTRPNQGMFVARLTLAAFLQHYEVMTGLEGMAAQFCARRAPADNKARLATLHQEARGIVEAADSAAYDQYNIELHNLIYRGTQNEFLDRELRWIRSRLQPYRRFSFQIGNRIRESYEEHETIVRHILRGEEQEARDEMLRHMNIQRPNFADLMLLLAKVLPSE